jgi:hypothetical protein
LDLLWAVTIHLEDRSKEIHFLWQEVLVTEGYGSVCQECEDRLFIGRVVMGTLLEVEIGVCGFTVYFVAQGAVSFPVYVDVQKR